VKRAEGEARGERIGKRMTTRGSVRSVGLGYKVKRVIN
jgi:hypothetical protein